MGGQCGHIQRLRGLAILLLSCCALLSLEATSASAARPEPAADDALTWDPEIRAGALRNGLSYIVVPHEHPSSELTLELLVRSGRFHDPEDRPGLSRIVQRCAYETTSTYPAGDVVALLQQRGVEIEDRYLDATMMRMTRYTLRLRQVDEGTIAMCLQFLRHIAGDMTFEDPGVERATSVVGEEERVAAGLKRRINEQVLPRLFPSSRFADRLIGIGTVLARTPDVGEVRAFYERWYVPERMAIVAVGDVEADPLLARIRAIFSDLPAGDSPDDPESGLMSFDDAKALVATDPELEVRSAQIIVVDQVPEACRTQSDLRREILERLALERIRVGLVDAMDSGRAPFQRVSADVAWFPGHHRMMFVQASGLAASWETLQEALIYEVRRAQTQPMSDAAMATLNREVMLGIVRQAQQLRTMDAGELALRCAEAFDSDLVLMDAEQHRRRTMQILADVDESEVRAVLSETMDLSRAAYLVLLPETDERPTLADVSALARRAAAESTASGAVDLAQRPLLEAPLPPGRVVELESHPRAGVVTAWLENGVVVHHRRAAPANSRARIVITLTGGQIEELAETRGLTQHASVLWDAPATRGWGVSEIRQMMLGRDVTMRGRTGEDRIRLELEGSVDDLQSGLELVCLLLTEPVIDDGAFARWQAAEESVLRMRSYQPASVAIRTLWNELLPAFDTRPRPLTVDDVRATPLHAVQSWIELLVSCAPIEVAVVGDIDAAAGVDLVRRTLGGLPHRARVHSDLHDELRFVERRPGPIDELVVIESMSEQAVALVGFPGADETDVRNRRGLDLAAYVFRARLDDAMRDRTSLVGAVQVQNAPATSYPGFGLFVAMATTGPEQAEQVADLMVALLDDLVAEGPTERELQLARLSLTGKLKRSLEDAGFWADALSSSIYHNMPPERHLDAAALIESLGASDVHAILERHAAEDRRIRIVVKPADMGLAKERDVRKRP